MNLYRATASYMEYDGCEFGMGEYERVYKNFDYESNKLSLSEAQKIGRYKYNFDNVIDTKLIEEDYSNSTETTLQLIEKADRLKNELKEIEKRI